MSSLAPDDRELCAAAAAAAARAYEPYSGFSVGAAVRTRSGAIHSGSNLEVAAYRLGTCAEVTAISRANADGDFDITTIAIVGHPTGRPGAGLEIVTPCGGCRQMIMEASQVAGGDIKVISCDGTLTRCLVAPISVLLPYAFGPRNLGIDVARHRRKA
ncbi:cytidine deaminase [Rhodoplanes azumiensis]|uniref:Cytidine deaminase n=1 Tax=Rhodoplanes azumiensis TaxID=1897628 RepID=A0ABW5AN45_9BRAD